MMMMMIDIIKRMPVPSSVMYMDWDEDNDKEKAITGYEFIKILIHSTVSTTTTTTLLQPYTKKIFLSCIDDND